MIFYQSQMNIYDGFETIKLSKIWTTDRMAGDALQMQTVIVKKGNSAARITLHSGAVFETGLDKHLNSERNELREVNNLM